MLLRRRKWTRDKFAFRGRKWQTASRKVRGNYLYGAWDNTTVAVRKLVRRKVRLVCDTNKAIYLLPIGDRAYVLAIEGECWKCLLSISKTLPFVVTFFEHVSKQCVSISLTYNSTSVYFLCLQLNHCCTANGFHMWFAFSLRVEVWQSLVGSINWSYRYQRCTWCGLCRMFGQLE